MDTLFLNIFLWKDRITPVFLGIVIANIAAYFIFYDGYSMDNKIIFWLYAEFLIIIAMRIIIRLVQLLYTFIFPSIKEQKYKGNYSSAANAVKSMFLMSIFVCILTFTLSGLPVKAPTV